MECWKRNDPSLRIGDSEEDVIVVSDDEEEVEAPPSSGGSYQAPPLAECIGPVVTGQRAVCSSPGYREAREQRRQEKLKAQELEPVKGTHAVRKRVSSALIESFVEAEQQYELSGQLLAPDYLQHGEIMQSVVREHTSKAITDINQGCR